MPYPNNITIYLNFLDYLINMECNIFELLNYYKHMIFDDFIESSMSNSFLVTHHKVTAVGYDDDQRPSWEDSTKEDPPPTFRAVHNTSKTTDWLRRITGNQIKDDTVIEIPSHVVIDEFAHEGVKDLLQIGDRFFEAEIISDQTMFDMNYKSVTINHKVGVTSA